MASHPPELQFNRHFEIVGAELSQLSVEYKIPNADGTIYRSKYKRQLRTFTGQNVEELIYFYELYKHFYESSRHFTNDMLHDIFPQMLNEGAMDKWNEVINEDEEVGNGFDMDEDGFELTIKYYIKNITVILMQGRP